MVSPNRPFTQEDPIGIAGGLNLYGYANGDPINFSDPFGLCPQWLTGRPCGSIPEIGGLNPVKALVGSVNIARGLSNVVAGAGLATAGGVATVPFGPAAATGSATLFGGGFITLGVASMNRGLQQLSEAAEGGDGSARNLAGLLPWGQEYDDATEPTPTEYFQGVWQEIRTDPAAAVEQLIGDFFSIENRRQ